MMNGLVGSIFLAGVSGLVVNMVEQVPLWCNELLPCWCIHSSEDYMEVPVWVVKYHCALQSSCISLLCHQQCTRVHFSPTTCQYLLLSVGILIEVRWYFIVVLICMSLMAAESIFSHILVGHLHVSFENLIFKSYRLFVLLIMMQWMCQLFNGMDSKNVITVSRSYVI